LSSPVLSSPALGDPRRDDPWQWQPPVPCRWEQAAAVIRLDGAGVLRFLHGQTSQDLERARPGQCLATCCITSTARLRGLAEVLVEASGAWLVITAGDSGAIHQALDRVLFPADQVVLGALQPARLITALGAESDPGLPGGQPAAGGWERLGPEPGAGWRLAGPERLLLLADEAEPAWLAPWLAARSELPAAELERWRLQQGRPQAPAEINDDLNPFELGLADRVSLSKGCYVGQETLAKLATYDGVKQQLRRWLWCPDPAAAAAGAGLASGTQLHDANGQRAGLITSCQRLPARADRPECWIGLALVRRQALGEERLLVGEQSGEATGEGSSEKSLEISLPAGFSAPPLGAGRAATAGS